MKKTMSSHQAENTDKKFNKQWDALRSFMTKKAVPRLPGVSSMRYNPFGTVHQKVTGIVDATEIASEPLLFEVVDYECEGVVATGVIRRREGAVNKSDLAIAKMDAVDNTGSFHWPTEEALAYYLLKYRHTMGWPEAPHLLEIGAGSGVTGFLLNAAQSPSKGQRLTLSDGNAGVCQTLRRAVMALPDIERRTLIDVAQVLWHEPASYANLSPDYVIGSDCFFFDAYHEQLADMLCAFKGRKPGLVAVMMAPARGTTLERFVKIIRERLVFRCVEVVERYDEAMWLIHMREIKEASSAPNQVQKYSSDKNYPLLVIMK